MKKFGAIRRLAHGNHNFARFKLYDRLRPAMRLDPDHKYDIGFFSAVGSAHFALISIQVFLNGLNNDIRALHIEGAPAFNNKTHQPVI
jgi:hypothetical protein